MSLRPPLPSVSYLPLSSAGTRDSPLTNHGVLQASRLGSYLASTNVTISRIFSSDLQRAFKTAEAVRLAQPVPLAETIKTKLLREKDFGSYEGRAFTERSHGELVDSIRSGPGFKDVESKVSMVLRMETFFESHLAELFESGSHEDCVAVVSHGIVLSYLWRSILKRFPQRDVVFTPSVAALDPYRVPKYLATWSNTGYMDLEFQKKPISLQDAGPGPSRLQSSGPPVDERLDPVPQAAVEPADSTALNGIIPIPSVDPLGTTILILQPSFHDFCMTVKAVNCRDHLRDLKKTRGGIGSLEYDAKQTSLDSFVKRRRI